MTHSFNITMDLDRMKDDARMLASTFRAASYNCPEAIERNLPFIRETLAQIHEDLAAVEAKLPKPKEVRDAA